MNIRLLLRSLPASLFILRCAAWLVPVAERAEWLAEWQAEVWHVWHLYRRGRTQLISVSVLSRTPSGSDGTIRNRSHGGFCELALPRVVRSA